MTGFRSRRAPNEKDGPCQRGSQPAKPVLPAPSEDGAWPLAEAFFSLVPVLVVMAADVTEFPAPKSPPKKGVLRERFEAFKDSALDSSMEKGESWAKKVGYGNQGVMLDDIPKLIEVLGLKVVDKSKVCVDRNVYEAYKTLAGTAITEPKKLDWDE